jgi:hypothetical protein
LHLSRRERPGEADTEPAAPGAPAYALVYGVSSTGMVLASTSVPPIVSCSSNVAGPGTSVPEPPVVFDAEIGPERDDFRRASDAGGRATPYAAP